MVGYRDETVSLMQDIVWRTIEKAKSAATDTERAVALEVALKNAERLHTLLNDPFMMLEADDGR